MHDPAGRGANALRAYQKDSPSNGGMRRGPVLMSTECNVRTHAWEFNSDYSSAVSLFFGSILK